MPFAFLASEVLRRRERAKETGGTVADPENKGKAPTTGSLSSRHRQGFRLMDALKPNKAVSQTVFLSMGLLWLCTFLIGWFSGNSSLLPSPSEVLGAFPKLWFSDGLGEQLWVSFSLNLQAIGIMSTLSLVLAYLTVMPVFRPFAVLWAAGRFNGFIGLPLIFMMLFHDAHWVKVAMLVFGMSVFTVPAVVKMIDSISKEEFDHARTLRMSEWHVVWEVVILGRFDEVLEILRNNVAMGWMMLPMVEGRFKFEGGVGALLMNEDKHLNLDIVYCGNLIISALGLLQDYLFGVFKNIVCPYSNLGLERN
jgi:NitT/TauT family transport system permease protein